jgi:hypothetical protein
MHSARVMLDGQREVSPAAANAGPLSFFFELGRT